MSYVCEAFAVIYIGLTSIRYWLDDLTSPLLVLSYILGILALRIVIVVLLSSIYHCYLRARGRPQLSKGELCVVVYVFSNLYSNFGLIVGKL